MPPTPLVEWEEQELADGATSFAERIQHILNSTIPSTTPYPISTTTTAPVSVAEKIQGVVASVLPHLTEAVQRNFVPTSGPTKTETTTPPPVIPDIPTCNPGQIQVKIISILPTVIFFKLFVVKVVDY
jgi:hypothetical protein